MTLDRTPPQDQEAERSALNLVLTRGGIPDGLAAVSPSDFYQPAHEQIWRVALWLRDKQQRCDAIAVNARLAELGQVNLMKMLPSLISGVWQTDAETLARIILDRAGRRRLIEEGERLVRNAYESEDDYETIIQKAEQALAHVPGQDSGNTDSLMSLSEFLGVEIPEPDWVVEGLLARGERLILTGTEGLGKSTLQRQFGVCGAAGVQPFSGRHIEPCRVLLIDVENPEYIMQKRFSEMRQAVNAHGGASTDGYFFIDRRPNGIDLGDAGDRRWLQRRFNKVKPDLLVIGPAYKLHEPTNDDKDETIARVVTGVLDDIRGDAAVILEHHAGNEQNGKDRPVRPFGSSLWRRWPEFGMGLREMKTPTGMSVAEKERRRLVDLVRWRGGRDVRSWPYQMESGGTGLPWVETAV